MQASLPLEMLRSWDFLDHGEEKINPILCHPEQGPVNSEQLTVNSSLRVDKQSQMCDSTDKNCSRFTGYCSLKRKVAFTLAEVLITLGIIGVVAALTLPTLISNYQKRVYVNQLKKSVSSLSNGFKLMMAKDGVTELKDTEAFSGITVTSCANFDDDTCKSLLDAIHNTFAGVTYEKINVNYRYLSVSTYSTLNDKPILRFPDGSYIYNLQFRKSPAGYTSGTMGGYMGNFMLDVNGSKNPNTFGRDIFTLYIGNNGIIYPEGSQATSEVQTNGNPNTNYWRTTNNEPFSCRAGSIVGQGCAGRVLEEDAMNY